jgi:hypothetical protein
MLYQKGSLTIVEILIIVGIIGIFSAAAISANHQYNMIQLCGNDKITGSEPQNSRCEQWRQSNNLESQRKPQPTPLIIEKVPTTYPIPDTSKPTIELPTPATPAASLSSTAIVECIAGYMFVGGKQLIGVNGGGVQCSTR